MQLDKPVKEFIEQLQQDTLQELLKDKARLEWCIKHPIALDDLVGYHCDVDLARQQIDREINRPK